MFQRPKIMGILNVTPDSFSDGGKLNSTAAAVKASIKMIEAGADIIDIGGESTRPGAKKVSIETEMNRTIPVIKALKTSIQKKGLQAEISIDTRKSQVAEKAIKAGADIWNDVSGLTYNDNSVDIAASLGCPVIIMHTQGSPETMQDDPSYDDVIGEIKLWLSTRVAVAVGSGIPLDKITIDPGIGFGKTLDHNLAILNQLKSLKDIGCKLLLGASRKSYISKIDGSPVQDRLGGSLATGLWGALNGADIVRVHDVHEMAQALKVWEAIETHTEDSSRV